MAGRALTGGGRKAGGQGEAYAAAVLREQGCKLLAANYHSRYGEIDLIVLRGEILCFVEVKTRRRGAMVGGAEAVGKAKRSRIVKTALCYLQEEKRKEQPRFDLFLVETGRNGAVLSHDYIEGAFECEAGELGW